MSRAERGDDGGRSGSEPGETRGLADRLLRVPLYHKLVGANVLLLLATLAGALWVSGRGAPEMDGGPLLLGGLVVGLGAALNLTLVWTALGPVKEIEETARRVERGEFDARARPSPVADRDLRRLTEVFNRMLDVVGAHRRRQRALTLRTFEREERDHAETARRLRESTAQRVATLLVQLRALRNEIGDRSTLDQCRELARETLEDLRRTARGLRRPEIDDLGLGHALRAYATDLAGSEGPRVEMEDANLRPCLTKQSRFRLYRILQEAVANAVEHADADTVTLHLGVERELAFAEIRDDGSGFGTPEDPAGLPAGREGARTRARSGDRGDAYHGSGPPGMAAGRGLGLVAMRERARDLGAELSVESEPGRGTTVRVELPCDAADASGSRDDPAGNDAWRPPSSPSRGRPPG